MPFEAITQPSDSQNPVALPSPLFYVYDSITDTWYQLDPEAWSDLVLQADDQEQPSC